MIKPVTAFLLFVSFIILFCSCETIRQSSKYGLSEGNYLGHAKNTNTMAVYVFPDEDSVKVYHKYDAVNSFADSGRTVLFGFPTIYHGGPETYYFTQRTLDLDILSILLKYRPSIQNFPNQLNTSILNGAVFFGLRKDAYRLHYKPSAFGLQKRVINHFGTSFGIFTGIGASRIDPFVTQGALSIEYDGLVNPSGVAAIIAVDKLTFGITGGVDHLLDKNHGVWIYQGKPWIGLSVGLNLN